MINIFIYCADVCHDNPGKGSIACIVNIDNKTMKTNYEVYQSTTKERNEIRAAILGLKTADHIRDLYCNAEELDFNESCNVTIISRSAPVFETINNGIKEHPADQDLWTKLQQTINKMNLPEGSSITVLNDRPGCERLIQDAERIATREYDKPFSPLPDKGVPSTENLALILSDKLPTSQISNPEKFLSREPVNKIVPEGFTLQHVFEACLFLLKANGDRFIRVNNDGISEL